VTALLGPNGAGKTTLLRCLVGLAVPECGEVVVGDEPLGAGGQAWARVGYVPQHAALPPLVRVWDVVGYAGWLSGLDGTVLDARVQAALDSLQVADLAGRRVRTLSGGQRQRVALATGIVHDPSVLVLDEPTAGLDPGQRMRVRGIIKGLAADRPVLMSTHLTEDVEHVAGRVAILAGGKIRYQGPTDGLPLPVRPAGVSDDRLGSAFERAYDDLISGYDGQDG